jgi:uncharacterized protein
MELSRLIEALSHPAAYPHPIETVEVCQTHISVVFLAGSYAYKVKKPVNLGFLDFSTLKNRRHFCDEELRLNRRLAPRIYLKVVPITTDATGIRVEGCGEAIEWAVKMERLPKEATLENRLERGEIGDEFMRALAREIASFHARAERGDHISAVANFENVARNAWENFGRVASQDGATVNQSVVERVRVLTEESLARLRPMIESRAARGIPRDTHGDLRLDHVYLLPDRNPPGKLAVIDCIEFNERFRFADPVADMAFLLMDLAFHGRRDLASVFADEYFRASDDEKGRPLLPFYTAYRAVVRAKVEGLELLETEIPEAERTRAAAKSRAHWLLALGELEVPSRRPCLVLVGGLPGTGKSTIAAGLVRQANFRLIRSDIVRKELAGLPPGAAARSEFAEGIYAREWSDKTYAQCLNRAETLLLPGERVLIDASFGEERRRRDFLELAARLAVPAVFIVCHSELETIRRRLDERRGDASDANWSIHRKAAERWEEVDSTTRQVLRVISTDGMPEQALSQALGVLRELSLLA